MRRSFHLTYQKSRRIPQHNKNKKTPYIEHPAAPGVLYCENVEIIVAKHGE
jgi:hypothetical protein